ncbi:hypothetical protein G5V59_02635 [Nocardioides sp. W3-2-3]|uniref:hypothetical protein n=1 Tax=Nocardioides convexus TaxID=2712224 RepID=UPI002418356D|nr:hypothetical protein [Nocardioides convexus]NGZ99649.1 hypothetical protein [Nocardioides convexus]
MTTEPLAPRLQGLDLFEVYEANGALLLVSSSLPDDLDPTDRIYIRPWATSAPARGRENRTRLPADLPVPTTGEEERDG